MIKEELRKRHEQAALAAAGMAEDVNEFAGMDLAAGGVQQPVLDEQAAFAREVGQPLSEGVEPAEREPQQTEEKATQSAESKEQAQKPVQRAVVGTRRPPKKERNKGE